MHAASGGDLPAAVADATAIRAEAFLVEDYLRVTVTSPKGFAADATDVFLAVCGVSEGRSLEMKAACDTRSGAALFRIEGKRLPEGVVELSARSVHRASGKASATSRRLDRPLRPQWRGTKVGLGDDVPAPWTPLAVEGDTVRAWGRSYRFDKSPLPTEVVSRGASMLAGPIRLVGRAEGKPLSLSGEPVAVRSRQPGTVTLAGRATSERLALSSTITVEYDGMVRADLAIEPVAGPARLEQLILEIPLRPAHARYLYHFPGQWGSVANSGFLPAAGWAAEFRPFVWLGDEDRGLSWFCESDQGWSPADPKRAITIDRQPDAVVLRCRLIERPTMLSAPLRYTFGFQATPVKQPEKTPWDYRITHHGDYGVESRPAEASGPIEYSGAAALGPGEGGFECWYRPGFDTERHLPAAERKQRPNRDILTIRWGNDMARGSNCGFYWNGWEQALVAWSRREGNVTLYLPAPVEWKAGQWHHLAIRWGDRVRLYCDGKLVAESGPTAFLPADPQKAIVALGGHAADAAMADVRFTAGAAPPAPNDKPGVRDDRARLVDDFASYGVAGAKTPGHAPPATQFTAGRYGRGVTWERERLPTRLSWLASQGVRTICFHEHWSPYQSHPYVTEENRPRLKSLVEACQRQNVALLLYMARQFADNAPEWELRSQEMLEVPNFGVYERQPKQKAYYVCWRSPWKEFCLYHLDRLLAEFGHDGWYLDGPEWPMPCTNRSHGCGYTAADGAVRPTYDLFATRDFMKRLYVLTRRRRPQGQLNIHNSTVMVIPTLGWGTSSWGGEQIDAVPPPADTMKILPMDAFRTEFMGRQWGVPSEFLVYDGQPYFAKDLWAYTLLHGVLIRPTTDRQVAEAARVWRLADEFPLSDARLHPYWNNADLLSCTPPGVFATAWERPSNGLLVVVSNLSPKPAAAQLTLRPAALGWTRLGAIRNALSGETLKAADGSTIPLALGPWEYRVLRVYAEGVLQQSPGSRGGGGRRAHPG